ncbi:transposase zinc-binding domain-containing protein [Archangium sp.]|uniref:transposase zinc-binding domain-containing protein n=1 Tax=Archangium sp. TaxID=1872627 RepID=UPI0039C885C5
MRCERCKDELLVAFWCKGRGVCPSCNAKRAQVTAVHRVERVLPHVPYRQWTLSFPHRVRWVLLQDAGLLSDVLTLFIRAVFALQRRRARRQGLRGGQAGAVSFIQFFGSALQVTAALPLAGAGRRLRAAGGRRVLRGVAAAHTSLVHGTCEAGPSAGTTPGRVVLRREPPWPTGPGPCRAHLMGGRPGLACTHRGLLGPCTGVTLCPLLPAAALLCPSLPVRRTHGASFPSGVRPEPCPPLRAS